MDDLYALCREFDYSVVDVTTIYFNVVMLFLKNNYL